MHREEKHPLCCVRLNVLCTKKLYEAPQSSQTKQEQMPESG